MSLMQDNPNLRDEVDQIIADAFTRSEAGLQLAVLGDVESPSLITVIDMYKRMIFGLQDCVRRLADELDARDSS
jgi:hypothetical protein